MNFPHYYLEYGLYRYNMSRVVMIDIYLFTR